ncbi:unnamed protein product [Schistosoma mattheei]|uniref:Uncharacterized protein n=1 Tax=Schistosoma mattheei TaxID=31246 RepID=A0A183NDM5_9TREM|nr:unnamed protein product [Schistosoma mattheei]
MMGHHQFDYPCPVEQLLDAVYVYLEYYYYCWLEYPDCYQSDLEKYHDNTTQPNVWLILYHKLHLVDPI